MRREREVVSDLAQEPPVVRPLFPAPSARSAGDSTQAHGSTWQYLVKMMELGAQEPCLLIFFLQQTDLFSNVLLIILARLQLLVKAKEKKEMNKTIDKNRIQKTKREKKWTMSINDSIFS